MAQQDPSVTAALVAGALAALGYAARSAYKELRSYRVRKAKRETRLLQINTLLRSSKDAFNIQVAQCRALVRLLVERSQNVDKSQGYDDLFYAEFPNLQPGEKARFDIIRGITQFALKPLNQEMLVWLDTDVDYRTELNAAGMSGLLARLLNVLASHLTLWLAQYEVSMSDPRHALVFLADEKHSGIGFPVGIDSVVAIKILDSRARRATFSHAAVLWIADRPQDNEYLISAFRELGMRVDLDSIDRAFVSLRKLRYDVIITDMRRPPDTRSVYALLKTVREMNSLTPIIVYAGSGLEDRKAATAAGAIESTSHPGRVFNLVTSLISSKSR